LSREERENISAISVLNKSKNRVDKKIWTKEHAKLIRRAASDKRVARIFVHPAIKKELCSWAKGKGKWLRRIRPWYGHHYHFHVRIGCPRGSTGCRRQKPVTGAPGCTTELAYWFRLLTAPPRRKKKPTKKRKPRPPITLTGLPGACRTVLDAHAIVPPVPIPVKR